MPQLSPVTQEHMEAAEILAGLKSRLVVINGEERPMYQLGELARALGREPVTIRKWEEAGIIPKPTWVLNPETVQGRRRIYSAEQVIGIVQIAQEEGILYAPRKPIKATRFQQRVLRLFTSLAEAA